MKTAAIIAEFNPYHNGHRHLLREARKGGADGIVCLMSGDYVQRGAPAVAERHLRAQMAMEDADLVLALPSRFSSATAEEFASASVRILDGSGCVDELWFGSECGKMEPLMRCARILAEEPEEYRKKLHGGLSAGLPYAKARSQAVASCLERENAEELLREPNNILAVEYLKALIRQESKIAPHTVSRAGAMHGDSYETSGVPVSYASSSGIRECLMDTLARMESDRLEALNPRPGREALFRAGREGQAGNTGTLQSRKTGEERLADHIRNIRRVMPSRACGLLLSTVRTNGILTEEDFSVLLLERLWKAREADDLMRYKEVGAELGRKMFRSREAYRGFSHFTELLTSKSLPRSHARRALLHIALGIERDEAMDGASCAQVLVMNGTGEKILSKWKSGSGGFSPENGNFGKNPSMLVVNPAKDIPRLPETERSVMEEELRVSNLYGHLLALKSGQPFVEEHRRPVARII